MAEQRNGASGRPTLPDVGLAWARTWRRTLILIIEHVPLVVGGTLVALIHLLRELVLPQGEDVAQWVRVLDLALLVSQGLLFVSLVVPGAITLLVELAEAAGVGRFRIATAWRTGERSSPEGE